MRPAHQRGGHPQPHGHREAGGDRADSAQGRVDAGHGAERV